MHPASTVSSHSSRPRDAGTAQLYSRLGVTIRLTLAGNHDALYQVRLLSALRSGEHPFPSFFPLCFTVLIPRIQGDPAIIHPFLADFGRDRRSSAAGDVDLGATALHLAIRCASCTSASHLMRIMSPLCSSIPPR